MSVLVTGASGNVGTYVVKELMRMGEQVIAAGTDTEKLKRKFGAHAGTVLLDMSNPATYDCAVEGADRVFLIRPPHMGKPEEMYPFIDALKDRNIQLVAFLSLMGVEKNPIPPHHKIEKYIEHAGLPYAHIRPGFFMQNLSGIHATEIRELNQVFIPAGRSRTSFIDTADIGLAAATLLREPILYRNTSYTLTGSESLDYYQVAEILSRVTGRRINYAKPSFWRYIQYYIHHRKLDSAYVNVTAALYLMTRLGTAAHVTTDFQQLTGREPRTLAEFAECHLKCFI
ncbi:NAD(P)-dependent oxidoreductase [Paenibacillus sp. PK3_47]|uniref:SDR family oxidoreductase n=1 Tax=Paenibacillus sp. PK3_47 TaxID=2072642 RepID=UPI00201E5E75|nr:SDR family oxidoreductase [Paenibacillus sp. PK3_47]UQZ36951.1 NAD(P)-dependent oxidoreductase [Paenibacillus sp. PK3_47]